MDTAAATEGGGTTTMREDEVDFGAVPFDAQDDEENDDDGMMMMMIDPMGETGVSPTPTKAAGRRASLLRLSEGSSGTGTGADDAPEIGGLEDDSPMAAAATGTTKRHLPTVPEDPTNNPRPKKKTKRKGRKVVVDNDSTELSNEHIKAMLADVSDIVKSQVHPAHVDDRDDDNDDDEDDGDNTNDNDNTYYGNDNDEFDDKHHPQQQQNNNNNNFYYETLDGTVAPKSASRSNSNTAKKVSIPSLTQAFLAEDGYLHPTLQEIWKSSFYQALNQPCPYERQDETVDDVEAVRGRRGDNNEDEDDEDEVASNVAPGLEDEQDFAPPIPMDDDDEELPPQPLEEEEEEEDDMPVAGFESEDDEQQNLGHHHQRQQRLDLEDGTGLGDLGMVNDLQLESSDDDDDDEGREAVGEHKEGGAWHKHTVKVLQLLQQRLKAPSDGNDNGDNGDDDKPEAVEFGDLAKNVNRRTAASCFIECLQLKTWDFLELNQDQEYGPITISAGPRFLESPPTK